MSSSSLAIRNLHRSSAVPTDRIEIITVPEWINTYGAHYPTKSFILGHGNGLMRTCFSLQMTIHRTPHTITTNSAEFVSYSGDFFCKGETESINIVSGGSTR